MEPSTKDNKWCDKEQPTKDNKWCDKEHNEDDPPSFEKVLDELGMPGRYQLTQLCLTLMSLMICAFMIMSIVFLVYAPYYECRNVNESQLLHTYGLQNDSSAHVSYQSCDIVVLANQSKGIKQVNKMSCPNGRDFFDAEYTTYVTERDLVCESKGKAEFSHTTFTIGQIIGGIVSSFIADRVGRKPVIIVGSLLCCLVETANFFSPSIYIVYFIKLLSGLVYQSVLNGVYIYGVEMVAPRHRQGYGVALCAFWVFHVLVVAAVAYVVQNYNWRYLQGAGVISGLMFLIHPFVLNESPRWLAANNRKHEALAILKKASKQNGKDFKVVKEKFNDFITYTFPYPNTEPLVSDVTPYPVNNEEIVKAKDTPRHSTSQFALLWNKRILFLMLVAWFIWLTNILTYFGLFITSSTLAGDRFLNFILMDLVEIPSLFLVLYMLNKLGRRVVLGIFMAMTTVVLLISTLLTILADGMEGSDIATAVLFIVGKFAISSSFAVVYIITPELFPTNVRSTASGVCNALGRIGSTFAPFLRPLHTEVEWGPAVLLSALCFISMLLIWFLPETKDKDLPNTIEDMMDQRKKKKKQHCTNEEQRDIRM